MRIGVARVWQGNGQHARQQGSQLGMHAKLSQRCKVKAEHDSSALESKMCSCNQDAAGMRISQVVDWICMPNLWG